MAHALTGSIHTSVSWVKKNWANLLQVTAIPILLTAFILGFFLYHFSSLFHQLSVMAGQQAATDPEAARQAISAIIKFQLTTIAGSLLLMLVSAMIFVRIIRLFVLGEKDWWPFSAGVLKATMWSVLYILGIYIITLIAVVLIMLVFGIIGGTGLVLLGANPGGTATFMASIVAIAGLLAFLFLVLAVPLRLLAGFAVVALGKRPDFMRDMWQLSKGCTWALVWRILAISVLLYLFMLVVFLLISGNSLWVAITEISAMPQNAEPDPAQVFKIMAPLVKTMLSAGLVTFIVSVPFTWVAVVWLGEVNRRLLEIRDQGAGVRPSRI